MKLTDYITIYGDSKDFNCLQSLLIDFIRRNGDDIEQLKAIKATGMKELMQINEYETQVRLAQDCIDKWREEGVGVNRVSRFKSRLGRMSSRQDEIL